MDHETLQQPNEERINTQETVETPAAEPILADAIQTPEGAEVLPANDEQPIGD